MSVLLGGVVVSYAGADEYSVRTVDGIERAAVHTRDVHVAVAVGQAIAKACRRVGGIEGNPQTCPVCCSSQTRVVDSRPYKDTIRRRRACIACSERWTTEERTLTLGRKK